MPHTAKPYPLTGLDGISDSQIEQHKTLYEGYVKKLNEIEEKLKTADRAAANASYSEIRELKKEEVFTTNAILLHEAYFGNLGGKGGPPTGKIADLITRDFGSPEAWQADLRAAGISARGWVVLAYNWDDGKLHHYLMDMHDLGGVWTCSPLLVLDVYEHAYMIDYGVKRPAYLEAFFKNVNWQVVNERAKMCPA